MCVPPDEPASRRLRAATAVLHQRVEDGMDLVKRTETLDGTVALLLRMEAFYRELEPVLANALQNRIPSEFLTSRTPRLRDDLDALAPGWKPLAAADLPELEGEENLGSLYVLEGAALGGQMIARHLHVAHGLTAVRGATFFASGGDPVGPRWKAFRNLLDQTSDFDSLERGATRTFIAFEAAVVLREAPVGAA